MSPFACRQVLTPYPVVRTRAGRPWTWPISTHSIWRQTLPRVQIRYVCAGSVSDVDGILKYLGWCHNAGPRKMPSSSPKLHGSLRCCPSPSIPVIGVFFSSLPVGLNWGIRECRLAAWYIDTYLIYITNRPPVVHDRRERLKCRPPDTPG